MAAEELMRAAPSLLPGLFLCFNSTRSELRKAVVFCLVDLYLVLGDWLMPHLAPLTHTQLKLVTLYIDKLKAGAAAGAAAAAAQ